MFLLISVEDISGLQRVIIRCMKPSDGRAFSIAPSVENDVNILDMLPRRRYVKVILQHELDSIYEMVFFESQKVVKN